MFYSHLDIPKAWTDNVCLSTEGLTRIIILIPELGQEQRRVAMPDLKRPSQDDSTALVLAKRSRNEVVLSKVQNAGALIQSVRLLQSICSYLPLTCKVNFKCFWLWDLKSSTRSQL